MRTVIIGAGAAGLLAARTAADCGETVTVVEKNERPARKVMITGKGRCNVTNDCDNRTLLDHIPENPRFLYSAFNAFGTADTKRYFESLGVQLKTERGNRIFPVSDHASDIVDALVNGAKRAGVSFLHGSAEKILCENGRVAGVKLADGVIIKADRVILATGGMSYPTTGSTGDGYRMVKELGHTVISPRPSLVPLCIREGFCVRMMGLSLKNVRLDVFESGTKKPIFSEQGEMLFTHFGITGPLVLSASSHIRHMDNRQYTCLLDLKPALDESTLDRRIIRDFALAPNGMFRNALDRLLPAKMIPTVVALSGTAPETRVNQISKEQRHVLCRTIKGIKMTVTGFRPIEEAIITSGGISVKEIDSKTMQSKIVGGLFFAGEIIDVDAYTGGFNLQIAFSTGYLAGMNGEKKQ